MRWACCARCSRIMAALEVQRCASVSVGHRVVSRGSALCQPVVVTQQVLAELYELVPLAPLHQPHNLAAIDTVFERMPDVPQVALLRHELPSMQSLVAKLIPLPRIFVSRDCSDMAFTVFLTSMSLPFCPRWLRKLLRVGSSSRISKRCKSVRSEGREKRR